MTSPSNENVAPFRPFETYIEQSKALTALKDLTNGADDGESFVRECRKIQSSLPVTVYCLNKTVSVLPIMNVLQVVLILLIIDEMESHSRTLLPLFDHEA